MNFLPKASGTRPRVACEIMPQGVVAARSADAAAPLAAVARVTLAMGAVAPGLKPGNVVDRVAVVEAMRGALEKIGERANARDGNLTLVIPDSAVRVLLLDFEALPARASEALPLVRFRLKKLLPFDPDEAMVSYQTMSTSKSVVRVLAVAIPRDVLREYEAVVREAGFEPGAVLPSTLACLAVVDDAQPALLVNANPVGVTAAIVRGGVVLLHRSVDLQAHDLQEHVFAEPAGLPLVDAQESAGEWAAQQPLPEHGRDPYADQAFKKAAEGSFGDPDLPSAPLVAEIAQAVSVAAAYFEDTLAVVPVEVLSAGSVGADRLRRILKSPEMLDAGENEGLKVRELVETEALLPNAVSVETPRAWLAGVLGALRG